MKRLYIVVVTCLFFVSCTCSSASSEDFSGTNASDASNDNPSRESGTTGIAGTVWMPANNPTALSNPSHAIPVFNALIYVSSFKPEPLDHRLSCIACAVPSQKHAFSKHDGTFSLNEIAGGDYWVTISKGGFRRSFEITIADDELIELNEAQTTLPSLHDPEYGTEIPSIALVTGDYDKIQDVLAKLGIGQIDPLNEFIMDSHEGFYEIYRGANIESFDVDEETPTVMDLLQDIELMNQYQIILFPCSDGLNEKHSLKTYPPIVWQNIREYIRRGGKLYVTDWSGDYVDNIFPEQMTFADAMIGDNAFVIDTPASAWDGVDWDSEQFKTASGIPSYDIHYAYAADDDLRLWLMDQESFIPILSSLDGDTAMGTINSESFPISDGWTQIQSLQSVSLGIDEDGQPVVDTPKVYVVGDVNGIPTSCPNAGCQPMTVTFEPVGCGRVMYSTYHTADQSHEGLLPQERILIYLMMELGECKSESIIN